MISLKARGMAGEPRLRVIGIDPTSRGFSYVLLEGRDLLDWASVVVKDGTVAAYRKRLRELTDRYAPVLVILEDPDATRRRKRARNIIRGLLAELQQRSVPSATVTRTAVRERFRERLGPKKQEIAKALSEDYPALKPRLPKRRRLLTTEANGMQIFDALSFVVVRMGW